VRYVVTEYGIADLWGRSVRERALALIEIAHPSFRAELLAQAKQRRYVFVDQRVSSAIYPWKEQHLERCRDGVEIIVRPVRMSDEEALQDFFYSLSDESARLRFMTHKTAYPHAEMQRLVDADYVGSLGLVASVPGTGELIAMARYDMDPATRFGDIAFAVRDAWQRRGIGSILMRRMLEAARANGLQGFSADVLAGNRGMLMVFQQSGLVVQSRFDGSAYHLEMPFEPPLPVTQRATAPLSPSSRPPATAV
jgi:GNAT superfamily N-acetyltransferase